MTTKELIAEVEALAPELARPLRDSLARCEMLDGLRERDEKNPPPQLIALKKVIEQYPGYCVCPTAPVPMVESGGYRRRVWAYFNASECPCFEPREVQP